MAMQDILDDPTTFGEIDSVTLRAGFAAVYIHPPEPRQPHYRTSAYDRHGQNEYLHHIDMPTALYWAQNWLAQQTQA